MGVMRKLNHYGDTETHWEPDDKTAVKIARALFDGHLISGGMAFLVPPDPREPAEVIRKFNPDAEEIVLAPRLVGG